ncbi:MAG: site-specific DNA-methyltransferase [Raineya sp.]|nr:site-specific DNA-methyltransferase [Raineya sp.]
MFNFLLAPDLGHLSLLEKKPILVSFRKLVPEITSTTYLTHGIYYYPAKFIPQVVRFCIENFTQKNDWIIDPFAGSGTVPLEAYLLERNCIAIDLNYLLNHIIPLKIPHKDDKLSPSILQEKIHFVLNSTQYFHPQWSNIAYWYPSAMLSVLERYWGGQKALPQDMYAQIIEAALLKVSKYFSYAEHKTPKLFKSKQKKILIEKLLSQNWQQQMQEMLWAVSLEILEAVNQVIARNQLNSARTLYFGGVDSAEFEVNKEADCLITSPPYLQAQEYIRTFKLDLYWLGYDENAVKKISKLEIPYRKTSVFVHTPTLDALRKKVHHSKLSQILEAYFYFTLKALENSIANLKKGSKICIFVGNPKIDGIEVETWRIFMEHFESRNCSFRAVYEDRIQSRQLFKARNNKNPEGMKSEFLLVMEKQ